MLTHDDPSNIRVIMELVLRKICVPKWITANVKKTLREEQKPKKQQTQSSLCKAKFRKATLES